MEIRHAIPSDGSALRRLAERDSAEVPEGELLVAVEGGRVVAAISLGGGAVIADPFVPTAPAVAALRAYSDARNRPRAVILGGWPGRRQRLSMTS